MSAHCVLKKININSLKKKIKKYCDIFGNQNPIWNGKKITKRYIWSHFIEKEKENMFSNLENRYFFHNAISFFSKKTLKKKPFDEFIQGKEDRYWINQRVKERKIFIRPKHFGRPSLHSRWEHLERYWINLFCLMKIEFLNSLDELLKYDKIYITDTIDKIEKKTNQLKH